MSQRRYMDRNLERLLIIVWQSIHVTLMQTQANSVAKRSSRMGLDRSATILNMRTVGDDSCLHG